MMACVPLHANNGAQYQASAPAAVAIAVSVAAAISTAVSVAGAAVLCAQGAIKTGSVGLKSLFDTFWAPQALLPPPQETDGEFD